ncbi:MAG TPA: aminotransferase class III-fold pyridoxal phosphate-dependent enzyme [Blastocatellia bacterium]|nr:aminotransferase class III-fold pyridoxal phosphate-dependent enzyme [Blastocatellia bacterium]
MADRYETSSLVQIRENRYSTGLYEKRGLTILRGEGSYLWDERGARYIDCTSGNGTANVGHANPSVVAAINEQAHRLTSCPESFYNDKRAELLEKLSDFTPDFTTRFLLCNSESEAIESAIRFARTTTGRSQIIMFAGSTHSVPAGQTTRQSGLLRARYNDMRGATTAISDRTAAVVIEMVQGDNGVVPASGEFVKQVAKVCQQRRALLIVDETVTGFGRTGQMLALEHFELQPDIITMANSIASGLPMGVVAITKAIGDKLVKLPLASAFAGNPIACAAACATIDYIREFALADRAREMGDYFIAQLKQIDSPKIKDVRGLGLFIGLEVSTGSEDIVQALAAQGILVSSGGRNTVRFLPPLVISKEDLDSVIEKTALVLK